jgi:DNA repair protein RadC
MREKHSHSHVHHGHRQRKKEQFLKSGIEHLPEHEPLEFLLYYAIPRGDTNAIAHALIRRFGSLVDVMNADYNELKSVDGIGENAASLICFVKMFSQMYVQRQLECKLNKMFNADNMKEFCKVLFANATEEEFHCLYLTDDLKLISHEKLCSGQLGKIDIPVRKIARSILEKNCSRLIISHNHPAGSCLPSRDDVDSTRKIRDVFVKLEVELTDHIIVGRDGVTSMKECGHFNEY